MTTTLTRANKYPAACIRCGGRIPAHAGLLARTDTGAWAADHDGPCPEKPMAVAIPVTRVDTDGIYRTEDGTIYKVQEARQGSGHLYAKRLTVTACTDTAACGHPTTVDADGRHHHGHFDYTPGAIHNLRANQRLPRDEAATFGRLYGICAACGADLTDEKSIARGIGPICGAKYF